MNRFSQWLLGISSAFVTSAVTATVFAHVVVSPQQAPLGTWQEYTMRVPCEKTDGTVKVVLKIPSAVEFEEYEPVAGWSVQMNKVNANVQTVTWQTNGKGILPGQFEEFSFIAKNPNTPTQVAWDAYQYYQDGTIVEWTGQPGSSTPHSMTSIVSTPATTSSSSALATNNDAASTYLPNGLGWTTADTWMLTVSIVALLLAGLALVFALRSGDRDKQVK